MSLVEVGTKQNTNENPVSLNTGTGLKHKNIWNKEGLVIANPWPSYFAASSHTELKYSWLNQAIWAYRNYREKKINQEVSKEIGRLNISEESRNDSDFMFDIKSKCSFEMTYKLQWRANRLFERLPESEQKAITHLSTLKNYMDMLKSTRNFEYRTTSGRSLMGRCNAIYFALTMHAYNKMIGGKPLLEIATNA